MQELEGDRTGLLTKQQELQLQHDQMLADRRKTQAQISDLQQRIVDIGKEKRRNCVDQWVTTQWNVPQPYGVRPFHQA